jgi:hypothetical protein
LLAHGRIEEAKRLCVWAKKREESAGD